MHVHEAMVNVFGNDLQHAHIKHKRGIDKLSVSSQRQHGVEKAVDPEYDMSMIAQVDVTSSIMLDLKSLCSTSNSYQHAEGKFG
jgi:hypothetical protein